MLHGRREHTKCLKDLEVQSNEAHPTTPYTPQKNVTANQAMKIIKNGIWALLTQAGALPSLWAECLYGASNEHKNVGTAGCKKRRGEPLTGVKPSFGYFRIFGCKVWAQAPEQSSKPFDTRARSVVVLRCLLYGKSCITLEDGLTVETTSHCLVREDVFP